MISSPSSSSSKQSSLDLVKFHLHCTENFLTVSTSVRCAALPLKLPHMYRWNCKRRKTETKSQAEKLGRSMKTDRKGGRETLFPYLTFEKLWWNDYWYTSQTCLGRLLILHLLSDIKKSHKKQLHKPFVTEWHHEQKNVYLYNHVKNVSKSLERLSII